MSAGAHLLTMADAARYLGISVDTLREHVRHGEIACVPIGRGTVRKRRMFDPADVQAFIAQRREREQCPSIKTLAAPTINMTSSGEVYDFMARRAARRAAKPSVSKSSGRKKRPAP